MSDGLRLRRNLRIIRHLVLAEFTTEEHGTDDDRDEHDPSQSRHDREQAVKRHHQVRGSRIIERQGRIGKCDVPMPPGDAQSAGAHHEK